MANISNPFNTDEVVGVIASTQSQSARAAAVDAGFSCELVTRPEAVDLDGDRSDDSMFDKVLRFFQAGEEKDALRSYRDRLAAGDHLIRIVDVGDRAKEAGSLLVEHEAELVWHFGEWTYVPLHQT